MQSGEEKELQVQSLADKSPDPKPAIEKRENEADNGEKEPQDTLQASAPRSIVFDKEKNEEVKAQYEPIKHKGSGTFGVVSKAKDKKTKKYVAL